MAMNNDVIQGAFSQELVAAPDIRGAVELQPVVSTPSISDVKRKSKDSTSTDRGRKFRKKLKQRELQACADIEALREQIDRLQAIRDLQTQKMLDWSHAAVGLVREYFAVFARGVPLVGESSNALQQEQFLMAVAEPDVKFESFEGVAPLMDQWRRYSNVHSFLQLELFSTELVVASHDSIKVTARGVMHLRYSWQTITSVFPHVLADGDLVQKLVGRMVHLGCALHYDINERGRITSLRLDVDYVGALLEVLGDVHAVTKLLDKALLKQHILGDVSYEPRGASANAGARKISKMDMEFILA